MVTYHEFFQQVFRQATGYVSIVTSDTEADVFPKHQWWYPASDLVNHTIPLEPDTTLHVYFTPHTYRTEDRGQRSDFGSCVWLECDDEYFNYNEIEEAEPSIVIETSPNRQHIYWLLDQPESLDNIERVNRGLAYKYLKNSRNGWSLGQLLRVPGFKNYKRKYPSEIAVSEFHPDRRYNFKDTFGRLRDIAPDAEDSRVQSTLPKSFPNEIEVLKRYEYQTTPEFNRKLRGVQVDRHGTLRYLINECARMNMPPIQAYALLQNSPNNVYLDFEYRGMEEFWDELTSAYRAYENQEAGYIQEQIEAINYQKDVKQDTKNYQIAELIRNDLEKNGHFFYASNLGKVLYARGARLFEIEKRNTLFKAFVTKFYSINPVASYRIFDFIVEHLKSHVIENGQHIETYNTSHYDDDRNVLYISNFNGGAFRLDGESITPIGIGDYGIVFIDAANSEPIIPRETKQSYLDTLILSKINFAENKVSNHDASILVKAWLYSTFLNKKSKALLVIEGDRGSGKSTLFKCLEWVLTGSNSDVTEFPENAEALKESIRNQHHIFFDGVDNLHPQHQNIISTVSTGTNDKKRILYKDNEFANYRLDAAMGISTMDARFLRTDIIDRSVILKTRRLTKFMNIEVIGREIHQHRSEIWFEMMRDLNAIVKLKQTYTKEESTLRMANFAETLKLTCQVLELDSTRLEKYLRGEQDETVLEADTVWSCLSNWLNDYPENLGKAFTARALYDELRRSQYNYELSFTDECKDAKSLAWKINGLMPNINERFTIQLGSDQKRNAKTYTFSKKED